MGRYAKANVTEADLKQMIEDNGGLGEIVYNDKLKVYTDLLKLDMGFDNLGFLSDSPTHWTWRKDEYAKGTPKFETITKDNKSYPVAWCYGNADGEQPVCFVVYIGQEGKLRAYIPIEGNNIMNKHSRDKETWSSDGLRSKNYEYGVFDYAELKESVIKRIDVK